MIAEDVSTPTPTHRSVNTSGFATTGFFSPPGTSLVVVCVAWLYKGTGSFPGTISVADSLGNSYTRAVELDNVQECSTAIFEFYYSSVPGAITVTATCTSLSAASVLLAPRVLTGAASIQSGAASVTNNNDAHMRLTTTATGSLVYAVGAAPVSTRAPTPDATLTQLDLFADSGTGNQGAVGHMTNSTGVPGKTWTGWTGNMAQGVALEVLPSPAIPLGTAGHPGPTWQTGQVLAASDVNTWILPLAQQKTGTTSRKSQPGVLIDPDLQLPMVTPGTWTVRMVLMFDGPSGVGLAVSFAVPSVASVFGWEAAYVNTSGNPVVEDHFESDTVTGATTGTGATQSMLIDGTLIVGATPGGLSLLWGQGVSNTQPVSVSQGSYFMAWRLG